MKKILLFVSICLITNYSNGFSIHKPVPKAIGFEALQYLKASEFVKLSAQQFAALTGKHMSVVDKLVFKVTKMRMKHELKRGYDFPIHGMFLSKRKSRLQRILGLISTIVVVIIALMAALYILYGAGPR